MSYRLYITDVTEEALFVTFALVVATADNTYTYGGGYVTMRKPVTEAALDAAVAKIVGFGDTAYRKKLTAEDRAAMSPMANPTAHRILRDLAWQKNINAWPNLGR
jgi:hypothetical protein|tara:strand:+ start:103 stop:417 length:315 start_codon:yes stop_codon:yes gene_type:complete